MLDSQYVSILFLFSDTRQYYLISYSTQVEIIPLRRSSLLHQSPHHRWRVTVQWTIFKCVFLYLSPPGCRSGYSRSGEGDRLKLRSIVGLYVWMRIFFLRKALRLIIISIDNPYVFCLSSTAYYLLLAELPSLSLWHW